MIFLIHLYLHCLDLSVFLVKLSCREQSLKLETDTTEQQEFNFPLRVEDRVVN